MKFTSVHSFDLTPLEARAVLCELRRTVRNDDAVTRLHCVAGLDVGMDRASGMARAAAVVLSYPALEVIEDSVPDVLYRGSWYFTFEGGCITYTFDTKGQLSGTVAADATANLGFYPGYQLWDIAFEESREGRE